jgi:hypothetical protein
MFSSRSSLDRQLNPLTLAVQRAKSSSASYDDLTLSNPTEAGLNYPEKELSGLLARGAQSAYQAESLGTNEARHAVAEEFGWDWRRVMITSSTSEAYSLLFMLLSDPGDVVLTPRPSYPLLEHLIRFGGLREREYGTYYDGSWAIDHQSLRESISPETRAIIAVSPNNPTGSLLSQKQVVALLQYGKPLIIDEVFLPYGLDRPGPHASALKGVSEGLAFSLGGLSKYAGLPHTKLAWVLISGESQLADEAMDRLTILADAYLSPNQMTQIALKEIFPTTSGVRSEIRSRIRGNLKRLRVATAKAPVISVPQIDAGWYAPVRLPSVHSSEEWAIRLLKAGVFVHPGYYYGFAEAGYIVLSLLPRPSTFSSGIDRLVALVSQETA